MTSQHVEAFFGIYILTYQQQFGRDSCRATPLGTLDGQTAQTVLFPIRGFLIARDVALPASEVEEVCCSVGFRTDGRVHMWWDGCNYDVMADFPDRVDYTHSPTRARLITDTYVYVGREQKRSTGQSCWRALNTTELFEEWTSRWRR